MTTVTLTMTNYVGGGIAVMIMFTIISLVLAIYFSHMDRKAKERYNKHKHESMTLKVPKAPENILLISFCWFMFIISSYMSLLYILETGEAGGNTAYMMTTLYTLILVVIFIFLMVKYREIFTDKLQEWGFL
jgi:tryptophan-rich sensory protein